MAPRKPPPPSAKHKVKDEEESEENTDDVIPSDDDTSINPRFRLFLVTTADSMSPLPGKGVKKSKQTKKQTK